MEQKFAELMNQIAEHTEYLNAEPLNNEEVNNIMERFRNENKKITMKKRRAKVTTILIAAVCAAACGGTAVTAFLRRPLDKQAVQYDYEAIGTHAQNANGSASAQGMELSVENVYCDGITTIIGISGSLKDGNPEGKHLISLEDLTVTLGDTVYNYNAETEGLALLRGSLTLNAQTQNDFSGTVELVTFEEISVGGTASVTFADSAAKTDYMDKDPVQLGSGSFSADITTDPSLRSKQSYTITEDDYSVRFYEISPAMMIVGFYDPDGSSAWLIDESRTPLEPVKVRAYPDYGDGYGIGCIIPVTDNTVTATFFDKNVQDAEGNIMYAKEIRIDMNEVREKLAQ